MATSWHSGGESIIGEKGKQSAVVGCTKVVHSLWALQLLALLLSLTTRGLIVVVFSVLVHWAPFLKLS